MANVLNMKELVGTSYYFLQKYFGNEVKPLGYDDFIPQSLKEKQSLERQEIGVDMDETDVEEIVGIQSVGSTVLENKDREEIAKLTLTELPTLYSNMIRSSVGLKFVPGKIVEEKPPQSGETKEVKKLQTDEEGEDEEGDKGDESIIFDSGYEENTDAPDVKQSVTMIQVEKEKQQLAAAVVEANNYKVIEKQEQQSELDQLKQWVDKATVDKTKAEINLKKAEDDFDKSKGLLNLGRGDETLEKIMKDKQAEKDKVEADYNTISQKYLEALKIEREKKRKELEEEEKQKKKQTIPTLETILEEDESEEEKADVAVNAMNTALSVDKKRAEIEEKTKIFLTQAKEQLEEKQSSMKAFELSNLDSQEKIDSLRQKNETLKKEIDKIYKDIEKNTQEYVKVLVETQLTNNKEIDELSDKIGGLYDSIKLESIKLEITLKLTEENLKKKADDEQKQKEEAAARQALSEQEKKRQEDEVGEFIRSQMKSIENEKKLISDSIDRIQQIKLGKIKLPSSQNKPFIGFLNKQISTIEESLPLLESINTSIQEKLNEYKLTQNPDIKSQVHEFVELIENGKSTLPLAKEYLKTEEQKIANVEEIKSEIATFLQKMENIKDEITEKGRVIAGGQTDTQEIKDIMEIIKTQYKTVQLENDTLQRKIEGISDATITTENEKIKELIEVITFRFKTAKESFKKLQTKPSTTREVPVKPTVIPDEVKQPLGRATVTRQRNTGWTDLQTQSSNPRRQKPTEEEVLTVDDFDESGEKKSTKPQHPLFQRGQFNAPKPGEKVAQTATDDLGVRELKTPIFKPKPLNINGIQETYENDPDDKDLKIPVIKYTDPKTNQSYEFIETETSNYNEYGNEIPILEDRLSGNQYERLPNGDLKLIPSVQRKAASTTIPSITERMKLPRGNNPQKAVSNILKSDLRGLEENTKARDAVKRVKGFLGGKKTKKQRHKKNKTKKRYSYQ